MTSKDRIPVDKEQSGNTLCNIATLMSQSGIRAGKNSHLCQFQGFLIQMLVDIVVQLD